MNSVRCKVRSASLQIRKKGKNVKNFTIKEAFSAAIINRRPTECDEVTPINLVGDVKKRVMVLWLHRKQE